MRRHVIEFCQRCDRVLGKTLVEGAGFFYLVKPHDRKLGVVGLWHFVYCPFDCFHYGTSFIIHFSCPFRMPSSKSPLCGSSSLVAAAICRNRHSVPLADKPARKECLSGACSFELFFRSMPSSKSPLCGSFSLVAAAICRNRRSVPLADKPARQECLSGACSAFVHIAVQCEF